MTSAIGWYGPSIDLSEAALHVGDFVQLLVFVHRSTPVQYKLAKGGEVIKTDIQVGDNTRPFFSVSLWQKPMGSMALAGDVVLLQNVKITKFGGIVEARTVQCSSLQSLIHQQELLFSKGSDDLIADCRLRRLGITTKEKLRKVIEWVQRAGSSLCKIDLQSHQNKHFSRNWKVLDDRKIRDCVSLSEVAHLTNSCEAVFHALVGEIFLPFAWIACGDSEKEKMFISRRVYKTGDNRLAEDFICTGCQLCGSSLDSDYNKSMFSQTAFLLYCSKSSDRLHAVGLIYRPFMLYVWDESGYLPLLVRNKAAEILFGNIKAERVYFCYREQNHDGNPDPKDVHKDDQCSALVFDHPKAAAGFLGSCLSDGNRNLEWKGKQCCGKKMNFYLIWLIFLKILLQQGNNSPLKFEVTVNANLDRENGRFEMVSVLMPCFRAK